MRALRRLASGVAALPLLAGCTSFADTVTAEPSAAPSSTESAAPHCPADRAKPDPHRPEVTLDFRLADDRRTVTGTETVVFTPDRATDRMVFRLVPNGPDSAANGNRLTVDRVRGDDVDRGGYQAAAASAPGGLYVVDLERRLAAGDSTEVTLDFTLHLGSGSFDRFGADDHVSWWGSGAPLLAWEPGVGWAEDPFVRLVGETATSPAADTRLTVSAPAALTVLMTGGATPSSPADGRRTWTATAEAARDVAVAVGEFTTAEKKTPDGVRVIAGVLPGAELGADELATRTVDAIGRLEQHVGPFPFPTLSVPLLPDYGGGIEYPSAIFEASPANAVLVHEVAHMWFYAMVGNSQFRDPWLDEAFATWAEAVADGGPSFPVEGALEQQGPVGGSMADYPGDARYFDLVYGKGGAALLEAEKEAGAADFEAAIRCYVNLNAWSIATPADLGAVLVDEPKALAVLLRAQALDKDDAPK